MKNLKKAIIFAISAMLIFCTAIQPILANVSNNYEYVSNGDFSNGTVYGWTGSTLGYMGATDPNTTNGTGCAMSGFSASYKVAIPVTGSFQLSGLMRISQSGRIATIGLYDSIGNLVADSEAKTSSTTAGEGYSLQSSFNITTSGIYTIKISQGGEDFVFYTFDNVSLLGPPAYEYLSDGKFTSGNANGWTGISKIDERTAGNAWMFNANYANVNSYSVAYKALSLHAGYYSLSCDFLKVVADNAITMGLYDSDGALVSNSSATVPAGYATWSTTNINSEFNIPSNGNYTLKLTATSASNDLFYVFSNVSLLGPSPTVEFTNYTVASGTNYISKVATGSKVTDFKSGVNVSSGGILLFKNGATSLTDTDVIGTGTEVSFNNGLSVSTFTIIVYGDVTGDGSIGVGDLAALKSHLLKSQLLTNAKLTAGNLFNKSDISISDLIAVKKQILGISTISQG